MTSYKDKKLSGGRKSLVRCIPFRHNLIRIFQLATNIYTSKFNIELNLCTYPGNEFPISPDHLEGVYIFGGWRYQQFEGGVSVVSFGPERVVEELPVNQKAAIFWRCSFIFSRPLWEYL